MSSRRTLTRKEFSSSAKRNKKTPAQALVTVDEQIVNIETQPITLAVLAGAASLSSNKILKPSSSDTGLTDRALDLLSALGASIDSTRERDYDLISTQIDMETINNPNIENASLKNIAGTKIKAEDKFSNPENAFYSLDETNSQFNQDRSEKVNKIKLSETAIQQLAADISTVNLSSKFSTKLIQFS